MIKLTYWILTQILWILSTVSYAQIPLDHKLEFTSIAQDMENDEINFSLSGETPVDAINMDIVLLYGKTKDGKAKIFLEKNAPIISKSVSIKEAYNKPISEKVTLSLVFKAVAEEDTSSKEISMIESDPFQFSPPTLKIVSVSYDAQGNFYTLEYDYFGIKKGTDVTVRLYDSYQHKTVEVVTIKHKSDEAKQNKVNISADNLFPALFDTVYVKFVITGHTLANNEIRDYEWVSFSPPFSITRIVYFYARFYWYYTLLLLIFAGYITFRQMLWYRTVRFAPFAVLPFQRLRASNKRTLLWQSLNTLNELYNNIGHPTILIQQTIQRVERLYEMPPSIEKLANISKEILHEKTEKSIYYSHISRYYDEAFLVRNAELLKAAVSDLAEKYWAINETCRGFDFDIVISDANLLDSLIKSLENLGTRLRKLITDLNPHASLFTRPTEAQSYQYLTEIQPILNQIGTDLRDNLHRAEVKLQGMQTKMEALIASFPKDEFILPEIDQEMNSSSGYRPSAHPLTLLLNIMMITVDDIYKHLTTYRASVIKRLSKGLDSINKIEDIPALDQIVEGIEARNFGGYIDITLNGLEIVGQEVSSALAQTPQSYGRRLSLQDAHIAIRDLYARLHPKAPEIAEKLQRVAELFEESSRRQENEDKKTYDNPYITGNPLRASNIGLFKGRANLASDLVNRLRGARNSTILLHGGRRMGKSSFLNHLENMLPATYISVFVDCQGAVTEKENIFFYQIARKTYDVLRKRKRFEAQSLSRPRLESYSASPALRFEEWLTDEVGPIIKDKVLLFTLDEFESIGNAIQDDRMSVELLNSLRHLIQHNEYVTFMFAGVATLDSLVYNAASYFISVSTVELSYLDNAAAEALISRPFDSEDIVSSAGQEGRVPPYDDDAVKQLMYITRNQPFLVQALCEQLINLANDRQLENVTLKHVEEVATRIHNDYPNYFMFFWNNWREDGQRIFEYIIHDKPIPDELNVLVEDMLRHRVIERVGNRKFRIEVPLVDQFIRKRVS
jgi:hypothetical protein